MNPHARNARLLTFVSALLLAPATLLAADPPPAAEAQGAVAAAPPVVDGGERFVKEGVVVDFWMDRAGRERPLREGEFAQVKFRVLDATSGQPIRSSTPGAWMDLGGTAPDGVERDCKEKVSTYLRGLVGIRPLVDLNSYYLLVLNQDPSISVIDPIVSMTGRTSLYATIVLEKPGADWARGRGDKRLFVSMPRAGKVAVVDGEAFKVHTNVPAGTNPTRVALQNDGRLLWVGNDAKKAAESGVTVIDTETLKVAASIPAGSGHHEIAFSADDRRAFVTSRDAGTVTIVDVATLQKVKDVKIGPLPISIATSSLSRSVYVADAKTGRVSVLDPVSGDVVAKLEAKPGLGPMGFTQDGRWGFVVNPTEHAAYVIDAATNRIAHTIPAGGQPYQLAFTRSFAYLRLLDSERVTMVNLAKLAPDQKPVVQSFPAGTRAPKLAPELSIASAMSQSAADAGMFIVSPADGSSYYYMEGMNAPMGSFAGYGHAVRAVTIVDRSLKEVEPGVYAAAVRIPEPGTYDVAFILDAPRIVHCFQVEAVPDEALRRSLGQTRVEFLDPAVRVAPGARPIRFRLTDPATRAPKLGLADVRIVHFLVPGRFRTEVAARELGDGVYEATPDLERPGSYYIHVAIPSLGVKAGDLPYRTVLVAAAGRAAAPTDPKRPAAK